MRMRGEWPGRAVGSGIDAMHLAMRAQVACFSLRNLRASMTSASIDGHGRLAKDLAAKDLAARDPARVVIIGNAAGGKSTLARHVAACRDLPLVEVDRLLWQEGWRLAPAEVYARRHAEAIAAERWVIEGLGSQGSIPQRVVRATEIVLIDLPLWMHFALAAERQANWKQLEAPPAGLADLPPTRALFKTMSEVDRDWLPGIRDLCRAAEADGKGVSHLRSLEAIDAFAEAETCARATGRT
jgi:adenylate kinase family enzyme